MARFDVDRRGVGEMLRTEEMLAVMAGKAGKIKAAAEAGSPYDPASGTHYRDRFTVETSRRGGLHKDRAVATVVNDDPAAFYIEYGTGDTPKFRVLGRAMDAAKT